MSNLTVTERVANGVRLLNSFYPGWERNVDVDTLKISSCQRCVLGQLGGYYYPAEADAEEHKEYNAMCDLLSLDSIGDRQDFGFCPKAIDIFADSSLHDDSSLLTEAWGHAIARMTSSLALAKQAEPVAAELELAF